MPAEQIENSYPLSPLQQAMVVHSLYAEQPGVCVQQVIGTLSEVLNVAAFKTAWQRVIQRHPLLRTSFHWEGLGEFLQKVHGRVALPIEEHDWRGLSADQQKSQLGLYLRTDRSRGLLLTEAPLTRLALFQKADAGYQFIWTYHHALFDGRSLLFVLKDVFAYYEAFCQNQDLQLGEPPAYRDYIDWLGQRDLSNSELFWKQTLKGFTTTTALGGFHVARPGLGQESYGEQESRLSETATTQLKFLAQQYELTLDTLVQGAWALLLAHYSGEWDVVFGATRACRHPIEGAESSVGLFMNILPIRVRAAPQRPLLDWLKEIGDYWAALGDHEHTPLVKIQEWSDVPRSVPLFDTLLDSEDHDLRNLAVRAMAGTWENRRFQLLEQTSYPLTVTVRRGPELVLRIQYDTYRFEAGTITRMLGHLQSLLQGMRAGSQRLVDLPLLTEAERRQLLIEWNDTRSDYARDRCFPQLFESQVARTPEAVAVGLGEIEWTYRELNGRANQLAHYLRSQGVGPEVLVGICMERSLEMVVGILGILKAGGAYVPLDPAYPTERLAFMLEDARVPVLLTQQELRGKLPAHGAREVCLDAGWEIIAQHSQENPVPEATVENLAYVIYTSGSTGKPKGVMVTHANLGHYVQAMRGPLGVTAETRYLHTASIAFSSSVRQLTVPLSLGAAVFIVTSEQIKDPVALFGAIKRHGVTIIDIVPSYWQNCVHVLAHLEPDLRAALVDNKLSAIVSASEPLLPDLPKTWVAQFRHDTRLVNMFGQTETTGIVTVYPIKAQDPRKAPFVPIGRPIANTQIHLLDAQLQPVPIGVPGELHVGGAGLGRGYLNRPELTAEKFVPDPFSTEPGARLYKTGDQGRYFPDGTIEFLGRRDQQVKIRGFRVERGEIESVLVQHPAVREAVVSTFEDEPGQKRLVAYVVPEAERQITTGDIRGFLLDKLPDYMVPSAVVTLHALPRTPNGKVDRKALPIPDWTHPEGTRSFVAPRNEREAQMTQIWEEVLNIRPIGVQDDFFELGGDSLLAARLFAQVHKVFGQRLPLASLFQGATIEHLVKLIHRQTQGTTWSSLVEIQPRGSRLPFFCVHGIGGEVLPFAALARHTDQDQPFYGLQARSWDEHQEPFPSIEIMAGRYLEEVRTLQPEGPYYLGGFSSGGTVAFEMAQQLQAKGQKVGLLAILDHAPLDLVPSGVRWHPACVSEFLKNVYYWITDDLLRSSSEEVLTRLRVKARSVKRRVRNLFRSPGITSGRTGDVGDILDVSGLLEHSRNFLQGHFQANRDYVPKGYSGRVTLLRARAQPLFHLRGRDLGWAQLVAGGVEVVVIPGSHDNVLKEPYVQALAEQLGACLQKAQAAMADGRPKNILASWP